MTLISDDSRTMLNCGKHTCPQRCHQLFDHSKVKCKQIIQDKCSQDHTITWECWKQSVPCGKCEAEAKRREAQRQRDHALDQQRQAHERLYAQKLAEVDDEIAHERRLQREGQDQLSRERILQQRKKDLADAKIATEKGKSVESTDPGKKNSCDDIVRNNKALKEKKSVLPDSANLEQHEQKHEQTEPSEARQEWEYQKLFENADNEHLDSLMNMIGLESVKQQVMTIKTKIDTCIRQRVNVKDERFGAVLLGNPGTGMTHLSTAISILY